MAERVYRFHISEQPSGETVEITGAEFNHFHRVLRLGGGARLELFDGAGTEYEAEAVEIHRSSAVIRILHRHRQPRPRGPTTTLAWGVCKGRAADLIIQKATELGVSRLHPFLAARSVVRARDQEKQLARWTTAVVEAAKQCGQNYLPEVSGVTGFEEMLRASADHKLRLLPHPGSPAPMREVLRNWEGSAVWIAVGPEGGFTDEEIAAAESEGFHTVSLGPNTLRAETACLAALSAVSYEFG